MGEHQTRTRSSRSNRLSGKIEETETRDSIGFFFASNGSVFAFPKSWQFPFRVIPGTDVGVAICGEIGRITPEMLRGTGIHVLFNPSREADDPNLRYRMLGLRQPGVSDDELDTVVEAEPYFQGLRPSTQEEIEEDRLLGLSEAEIQMIHEPESTPERYAQLRAEHRAKIGRIVHDSPDATSIYAAHLADVLREEGIVVLRSDLRDTTGILNPTPELHISEYETTDAETRITWSSAR